MTQKSPSPLSIYVAYSAPYLITVWLLSPLGVVKGIYAKYYGLSLTTIAAVILFTRLFDAITDPLIGYYNDRYYQRTGTRKPFILVGGSLYILSAYFLFVPTDITTLQPLSQVGAIYFAGWFLVLYLTWTCFEVAHVAWANELAHSSEDKTKLFSVRTTAYYLGMLLFYAIPLLPLFETNDITPETLRFSVITASTLMLFFLYYCLKVTPDRYSPASATRHKNNDDAPIKFTPASQKNTAGKSLGELRVFLKSLISNSPFLLFISAFLFKGLGSGIFYGVFYIYIDAYLGLGHYYAQASILGLAVGIVSIPIWQKLANTWGKKNTWLLSMLLMITGFITISTFEPGDTQFYHLILAVALLNSGIACMSSIGMAMLAEIIDYSTWKYRSEKTATYFSLYAFLSKTTSAIAQALGLGIAGWYGLDVTATHHDEHSVWGLRLVMTWIPLVFVSLALVFIALSPISAHRHAIVRRRLDTRIARTNSTDIKEKLSSQNTSNPEVLTSAKSALIGAKD